MPTGLLIYNDLKNYNSAVNTKVDIRFHVDSAEWIPEWVRQRLCQLVNTFISKIACVLYVLESVHCFCANTIDMASAAFDICYF